MNSLVQVSAVPVSWGRHFAIHAKCAFFSSSGYGHNSESLATSKFRATSPRIDTSIQLTCMRRCAGE